MTPCAVLDLDDPRVGVEAQFPREAFLDLGLRSGLFAEAAAERPIRRPRVLEYALRRRTEQLRGAVEPVELDENGPGLLGATPSYRRKLLPHGSGAHRLRPRLPISGAFQFLVRHAGQHNHAVFTTCAAVTRAVPRVFFDDCETARPCAMKAYSNGRPVIAASSRTTRSVA